MKNVSNLFTVVVNFIVEREDKMFKKILLAITLSVALIFGCFYPFKNNVFAEETKQQITYVAFGDSISEGGAINLRTKTESEELITGGDSSYGFVQDSYPDLIKKDLEKIYDVVAYNFSYSGDTCQDLIDFIKGDGENGKRAGFFDETNLSALNSSNSNEIYTSLTNENIYEAVKSANIITVCIGANNILKNAQTLIMQFLGLDQNKTVTRSEIEDQLRKEIEGDTASNIKGFITEFQELLATLNKLNPNAKIYFTNVYNPYKVLIADTSLLENAMLKAYTQNKLTQDNLDIISEITEMAIAGGTDSLGKSFTGINNVIENEINKFTGSKNFVYIDSKNQFDAKYDASNKKLYNDYVNVQLEKLGLNNVMSFDFDSYLDPHPTYDGHKLIFNAHKNKGLEVYIKPEAEKVMVTFNYNGGKVGELQEENVEIEKGTFAVAPTGDKIPKKQNHKFAGWFKEESCVNEFDFSEEITQNTTIFAKWEKISINVVFDYNGGKVGNQTSRSVEIALGNKITEPTLSELPTYEMYELIGWCTDSACQNLFDFDTIVSQDSQDITLFAKWEKVIFEVKFDYNGGNYNNKSEEIIMVKKGSLIDVPKISPVLEDYQFAGWFKEQSCQNVFDFSVAIMNDTTIYAGWGKNVFKVTFDYQGGKFNGNTSKVVKVQKNNVVQNPISADNVSNFIKDGYIFGYWYKNDQNTEFDFTTKITEDITLYAYWKEAINLTISDLGTGNETFKLAKGTTVGELLNIVKPSKSGYPFLGWFDVEGKELDNSKVLTANEQIYAKWVVLECTNESLLSQQFSPITKKIPWKINAKKESILSWQVNGSTVDMPYDQDENGVTWNFIPTSVGTFAITCLVDGVVANGRTVTIDYSVPKELSVSLIKVEGKRTYTLEIDNKQYYNASKFVWFKTSDSYSDDFDEQIGTGNVLNYKFSSDCKVCVKYLENSDSTDGVVSNSINITVDNYIDDSLLIAIIASLAVITVVIIGVVISKRRYKDFF